MIRRRIVRRLLAGATAAAVGLLGAGCGTPSPKGTAANKVQQLPADFLSGAYLGLLPTRESVAGSLAGQEGNSYVKAVGLYALRDGELLQATLQVSKLSKAARVTDLGFQEQVANQIGGTRAQAFDMGGTRVFRTSQRKQSITSWFTGDYFLILAVRDTYPTPRALLRELLTKVQPS